ncbi:MAG: biotin transporter BioY [Candidatus Omnitrophota bacterium]
MKEAILNREIVVSKTACRLAGIAVFVVLTALGAFVRVPLPFTPVPITLQTFFVLLSGAMLGPVGGSFSQLSYFILGLAGIPLFTLSGSGISYLAGPTTGYILGFIIVGFLIGKSIRTSHKSLFSIMCIFILGDLIILFCGALWLKIIFNLTLNKALFLGVFPFVTGDIIKAVAASIIYAGFQARLKKIF